MFVPAVLAALWPCAILQHSMATAFVHVSFVKGSVASFSSLVMVSPVSGWIKGIVKCSSDGVF